MEAHVCQRWSFGRCRWRPAREGFDRRAYEVAELPRAGGRALAKAFLRTHHYLRSLPSVHRLIGLYERAELVGLVVFSNPTRNEVLAPFPADAATDLGRLVLLDRVPGNAESWFVARCLELLAREGLDGAVSFSDPMPRETAAGVQTTPGHVGGCYKAVGAVYIGQRRGGELLLLPDATAVHRRSLAKIRAKDSRWRSALRPLVEAGAPAPTDQSAEGLRRWADALIDGSLAPGFLRPVRHPGNHKYLLPLTAAGRALAGASRPYPRLLRPSCPEVLACCA